MINFTFFFWCFRETEREREKQRQRHRQRGMLQYVCVKIDDLLELELMSCDLHSGNCTPVFYKIRHHPQHWTISPEPAKYLFKFLTFKIYQELAIHSYFFPNSHLPCILMLCLENETTVSSSGNSRMLIWIVTIWGEQFVPRNKTPDWFLLLAKPNYICEIVSL